MQFLWDEDLYQNIVESVETGMKKTENKLVFDISSTKYSSLVKTVQEEYWSHPAGPYQGKKEKIKQDTAYNSQGLLCQHQDVLFYGDAIQRAIDDASAAGGGRVLIPEGKYYTGAIELKSNVELHLEKGSVLQFVRNKSNVFYPLVFSRWEGVECMNFSPFLYAFEAENIAITGLGTMDGAADEFNWMPWKFGYFKEKNQQDERQRLFDLGEAGADVRRDRIFADDVSTLRPPFIQPYSCKNVRIEDITILNSPFWEINPVLCENVKVSRVKIHTNLYNNDGVDPESCCNVLIEDCSFMTGDDCIAIKSGRNNDGRRINEASQNIIIRNNRFSNGHGGITIGSEISGGVKNVFAQGNYFDSTELDYPIRFKTNSYRGGLLENIYVKDSLVNKSKLAVVHADFFYEEGESGQYMPTLRNITLENIQTVAGGSIDAQQALYLRGFKSAPIENITLKHVKLTGVKGKAVLQNIKNLQLIDVSINGENSLDQLICIDDKGCVQIVP